MNEKSPQFHPEVENAVETEGIDIGRIKDTELARQAAINENENRDVQKELVDDGFITEEVAAKSRELQTDRLLKTSLAHRAVESAANVFDPNEPEMKTTLHNIAVAGANKEPLIGNVTEQDARDLLEEARMVGDDYDEVQRQAELERNKESVDA